MKLKPLTARQATALQLTLDGLRKGEICERLGITQKTLWTWRRLPAWNEQLSLVLKDETGDGDTLVKGFYPLAVNTLRKLAISGTDNIRLGACRTLLEAYVNLAVREEQHDLMLQLEKQLDEIRATVASGGMAGQLTPGNSQVLDAEIVAHSHDLSHTEQQQEAEAE